VTTNHFVHEFKIVAVDVYQLVAKLENVLKTLASIYGKYEPTANHASA
jgi:hypothetical protein